MIFKFIDIYDVVLIFDYEILGMYVYVLYDGDKEIDLINYFVIE